VLQSLSDVTLELVGAAEAHQGSIKAEREGCDRRGVERRRMQRPARPVGFSQLDMSKPVLPDPALWIRGSLQSPPGPTTLTPAAMRQRNGIPSALEAER